MKLVISSTCVPDCHFVKCFKLKYTFKAALKFDVAWAMLKDKSHSFDIWFGFLLVVCFWVEVPILGILKTLRKSLSFSGKEIPLKENVNERGNEKDSYIVLRVGMVTGCQAPWESDSSGTKITRKPEASCFYLILSLLMQSLCEPRCWFCKFAAFFLFFLR